LTTEEGPVVFLGFDNEGGGAIASITAQLGGLPLGIFVDDELLAGPIVAAPIGDGQLAIAGLTLRDARILRAQLRAGDMPVPYRVISGV
jgi:preprotein translocase subunit SecD